MPYKDDKNLMVIVQCRTSSTRLPAKAFLDVHGTPSVVLCAKRLSNTGLPLLIAISDDESDDNLAFLLESENIPLYRGSLIRPLERFFGAIKDMPDTARIVRMTADNLYPDGAFIEECLKQFDEKNVRYASTISSYNKNELPYGMTAEIFTAELLREAYKNAKTDHEEEHVTPYMREEMSEENTLFFNHGYPNLRCTMDTLEDYLQVLKVFRGEDITSDGWRDLCDKLAKINKDAGS